VVTVSSVVVIDVVLDVEVVVVESRGPSAEEAPAPDSARKNPAATVTAVIRSSFKKTPVEMD